MNLLKKPLITEKISAQNSRDVYGLIVDNRANKIELKKAIEKAYGVTVLAVNTMRCGGKPKVRHTKSGVFRGKKSAYKKAFVTLKAGDVIDFYQGIQ